MSWKCPEKYIKCYIFFIFQWIEFKFENVKYISIYLTNIIWPENCHEMSWKVHKADFPKLAEKLSVIRTDRHEDLVRPKNILPVRKKSPKKFTVMCIMFSLAFLECFTPVLAIGHLISPLVFIEVKVIQFLVFSVVQNCICYVFYSVCLEFCCFDDLAL